MRGKVKWFNKNKGYGFIITEDNKEYFVHWKSIVTNSPRELKVLEQDEIVTFDLMETDKGTQAINIIRIITNKADKSVYCNVVYLTWVDSQSLID